MVAPIAVWAISCEPALWKEGDFLRAYNANIMAAVESVLEASPVAVAVRRVNGKPGEGARGEEEVERDRQRPPRSC